MQSSENRCAWSPLAAAQTFAEVGMRFSEVVNVETLEAEVEVSADVLDAAGGNHSRGMIISPEERLEKNS